MNAFVYAAHCWRLAQQRLPACYKVMRKIKPYTATEEVMSHSPWGRGHRGNLGDQQHQWDPGWRSRRDESQHTHEGGLNLGPIWSKIGAKTEASSFGENIYIMPNNREPFEGFKGNQGGETLTAAPAGPTLPSAPRAPAGPAEPGRPLSPGPPRAPCRYTSEKKTDDTRRGFEESW